MRTEVYQMSGSNPEWGLRSWEMTFLHSDPGIAEAPPEPGWELCTADTLATHYPEALLRWEEHAERRTYAPDECISDELYTTEAASVGLAGNEAVDIIANKNLDEVSLVATIKAQRPTHTAKRTKTRYEDMTPFRKATHVAAIGTAIGAMTAPCVADVSTPQLYSPPSLHYVDPHATHCPPGTTIGGFNVGGVGNNKISLYSAYQEKDFLPEVQDVCFAALIYGTDLDTPGNAAILHEYIETNNLKKVIIFAFSFGGMESIDILNEYNRQHPDSDVDFAVVFISSPAEFEDLHPEQKGAVMALSITSLDTATIKWMTFFSIIGQGDKDPLSKQVNDDTQIAANDTPPRLLWEQMLRLLLGMNRSDMKVTASAIYDKDDRVVIMPKAIQTTVDRSGLSFLKIVSMTHTDHRMNNHAATWWTANNQDYRDPFLAVIEANRNEFARKDFARALAQCTFRGRVIFRLAC